MRRRRDVHPERAAFDAVVEHVEGAKRALLTAVPTPRGVPNRPLAEALVEFETGLVAAVAAMPWRGSPETEAVWTSCGDALARSLDAAERLRLDAPALDYESLVTVLGDLMSPLEAFEDADRALES
jgi:hypothetical protein